MDGRLPEVWSGWASYHMQRGEYPEAFANAERALNRGTILFDLAARLIQGEPPVLAPAGRLYAAGSLQRLKMIPEGTAVIAPSRAVPSRYRRLTGLAVLAKRDLHRREPEATPGRSLALLRHWLTGKL